MNIRYLNYNELAAQEKLFIKTIDDEYKGEIKKEVKDQAESVFNGITSLWFKDQLISKKNTQCIIIAEESSKIYGAAKLIIHTNSSTHYVELANIAAFKGAGKVLFQFILQDVRNKQFKELFWEIGKWDQKLVNFYRQECEKFQNSKGGEFYIEKNPAYFKYK